MSEFYCYCLLMIMLWLRVHEGVEQVGVVELVEVWDTQRGQDTNRLAYRS